MDSDHAVENLYRQEFQLLRDMFEEHFSSEVIAGVLEDCGGDGKCKLRTLTVPISEQLCCWCLRTYT